MNLKQMCTRVSTAGAVALALLIPGTVAVAAPGQDHGTARPPARVQVVRAYDTDLPTGTARHADGAPARSPQSARQTAASWVCTVYASDPRKSGIFVEGDGSQFCSGTGYAATKITVRVQRHRWYGWQTVRSQSTSWSSSGFIELVDVAYDCSGDGTYTYRMVTTGYANGGAYAQSVQSLNYLRVAC